MKTIKCNLNDTMVIYPSEHGWMVIYDILFEKMHGNIEATDDSILNYTTKDGGFCFSTWQMIHLFHPLFFHGTKCFETMQFKIKTTEK